MLKKYYLVFGILLLMSSFVVAMPISKMYKVELSSSGSEVILEDFSLVEGLVNAPGKIFPEDYIVSVISHEDEVYSEFPFRFSYDIFRSVSSDCFIEKGIVDSSLCGENSYEKLEESVFILNVPFSPNAKFLRVHSPSGELLIERDVSRLSCGNLVCDSHESEESCLKDCAYSKYVFSKVILFFTGVLAGIVVVLFIFWNLFPKEKKFKQMFHNFYRWKSKWQN